MGLFDFLFGEDEKKNKKDASNSLGWWRERDIYRTQKKRKPSIKEIDAFCSDEETDEDDWFDEYL